MTVPQPYRDILEFLNKNKLDLLVIQEKIAQKNEQISDDSNTSEIRSHIKKTFKDIDEITQSCDTIIDFWRNIHNLTGGLRIQEVMKRFLDSRGNLTTNLKSLGIDLLKTKQAKPFIGAAPLSSINEQSWLELLSLLQSDTGFVESARLLREIQNKNREKRITEELQLILKIHPDISNDDKKEFKEEYIKTGISIEEFLKSKYPDMKTSTKPYLSSSDKVENKSDFDGYKAYMEADEREIARMKRTGEYSTRKRGKKRKRSHQ